MERLCLITGTKLTPAMMPSEAAKDGPKEARELVKEFWELDAEITRRNSKSCSREVSRFMKELDSREPLSAEVRGWWLDRY